MTLRRRLDWTRAMSDLRAERATPAARGFLASRSLERARLTTAAREAASRPLVTADGFDRSAIMTAALTEARTQRANGSRLPFKALLATALRFAWARAKRARLAS